MQYRRMGKSGIRVSELCFGNMTFGGKGFWKNVGEVDQRLADRMIDRCLDAGINFFDTADIYSQGVAETMIGKSLGKRRKDVILATKVRGEMGSGINDVGLSRFHIIQAVEASLKRLGTDYIDLYQVHNWDPDTPLEETLSALDDLVHSGKVRYIGCSNYSGWQFDRSIMISQLRGWTQFVTLQALYSLIHRDLELELIPLCEVEEIGILPWSPLAGGFLTGKYRRGKKRPVGTRLADPDYVFLRFDEERAFNVVEVLAELCSARDTTISQGALNWLRVKPIVSSIIIGARTMDQLEDNLKCVEWSFTEDEIAKLDEVSAVLPGYPYNMHVTD